MSTSTVTIPSFAYPFKKIKDMDTCFDSLAKAESGNYLFSTIGLWHGGVHFTGAALTDAEGDTKPLCAIADGELVAYRLNADYQYDEGDLEKAHGYSTGFFLVRHKLEYPAENKLTLFSLYMHTAPKSAYGFDPVEYEVKSGDTLGKIAQGHGMSLDAIKALNPEITPPDYVIQIGQKIKVTPITQAPTVLTKESPTDSVHILPQPLELKAGTPLGLVGEYNNAPSSGKKVLHVECFTEDDVKAFAEKAQETYPTDTSDERPSPTSLIIPSGTVLYRKEEVAAKKVKEGITHTNLRKAYASGEAGYNTVKQVKTGVILEIDESTLSHDRYKVLKNAGVDVSAQGWTVHKDYIVDTTYDAYTATETVTNKERSLPIEKTKPRVKDMEGKEFFELSNMYVAVENCTPDHGVTFKWAKAFDTASSDNASIFTNFMEHFKQEIGPDELKPNPLYQELFDAMDKDHDGMLDYPLEIQSAAKDATIRRLASRYAVKHTSEWGDTLQAFWTEMQTHLDGLVSSAETDREREEHEINAKHMSNQIARAQNLKFFPDCSGIEGFPSSDIVYFLHPVRVVGEMKSLRKRRDYDLGTLSSKYETGGKGSITVSSGVGDPGGVSYGAYQLTSKPDGGNVTKFINSSGFLWKSEFAGLTAGSENFSKKWKEIVNQHKSEFEKVEHEYIRATHFDKQINKIIQKKTIDLRYHSHTLNDVIWSTAVHLGPTTNAVIHAMDNVTIKHSESKEYDEALIKAIYQERGRKRDSKLVYFPRVSSSVQAGLESRFQSESQIALQRLANESDY